MWSVFLQVSGLEQQLLARKNKRQKNLDISKSKELRAINSQQMTGTNADKQKAALESELNAEIESEIQAARDKMLLQKEKVLEEERKKMESELGDEAALRISDEERKRLVANHETNLIKLGQFMDQERQRQEIELLQALEEKKRKKESRLDAALKMQEKERLLNEELQRKQLEELAKLEMAQERERQREIEQMQTEKERESEELKRKFEDEKKRIQEEEFSKIKNNAVAEEEKERLLNEAQSKIDLMMNLLSQEQRKQEALLELQISQKRARRSAFLQQKQAEALEETMIQHVNEAEQELKKLESEAGPELMDDDESSDVFTDDARLAAERLANKLKMDREKFEAEMEAAIAEQEKIKSDLQARQERERQQLEVEMAREAQQYEERLRSEQERRMEDLRLRREQIENSMSREAEGLSVEERERMIHQHEAQLRQLEQDAAAKKAAMDEELQAKIAQRRGKKQAQLKANKAMELRDQEEQARAAAEAMKQRLLEQRLEGLLSMVKEGLADEAVTMCRRMYEQDCEELKVKQAAAFAREMAVLSSDPDPAKVTLEEERIRSLQSLERDALSVAHQVQLAQLVRATGEASTFRYDGGKEAGFGNEAGRQKSEDLEEEKRSRLRKLQVKKCGLLSRRPFSDSGAG
jgi:hypothetical protein